MASLSTEQQNKLFKQGMLKKFANNEYLCDENNPNFVYLKEKFFKNETDEKIRTLVVGSGMFQTIAETFSTYVKSPLFQVGKEEKFDVKFDTRKIVIDYCSIGKGCIGISKTADGVYGLVHIPAETHIIHNGNDATVTLYKNEANEHDKNLYMLLREFTDDGKIYSKLYMKDGVFKSIVATKSVTLTFDKEVELTTLEQTADIDPVESIELDMNPLQVFYHDDENTEVGVIRSYFTKVLDIVYSLDRRATMQDTQFLQYVNSFILMKNIKIPEKAMVSYNNGQKLDFDKFGRILMSMDDKASVEFISNENSMLNQSIDSVEKEIRKISAITTIPPEFLGLETGEGAIGVGSRTLKHGAFISKIESIRDEIDNVLTDILEKIDGGIVYTWPDIFPQTQKEILEEVSLARENNLISQRMAVKKYQGLTDEEADKELQNILSDTPTDEGKHNGPGKKDKGDDGED